MDGDHRAARPPGSESFFLTSTLFRSPRPRPLDHHRTPLRCRIGLADRPNRSAPSPFHRPDVHEEDLVLRVMNHPYEVRPKLDELPRVQFAAKHRKLDVVAPTSHEAVHPSKPLRVRDVVADDKRLPHACTSAGSELGVFGDFAEKKATQEARLHLEHTAIANSVSENRMCNELIQSALIGQEIAPTPSRL